MQLDNGSLASGLAAAAYRLKEGQSCWLSAPILSPADIVSAVRYSHQMRMSAISGHVRANRFNRPSMLPKPDLLVWTRANLFYSRLRLDADIGVQRARTTPGNMTLALQQQDRILRTLLCQPAASLTSLCDGLAKQSRPFMHLIDLTAFGLRDGIDELLDHLDSYFPTTPKLILTNNCDASADAFLVRRQLPCWRQQQEDNTHWLSPAGAPKSNVELIVAPDSRLENPLVEALKDCQRLTELLKNHTPILKALMPIFYRVIRILRCLPYPLTYLEQHLASRRRGGLYPIMPLKEWLARATRIDLPTAEVEAIRDRLVDGLHEIFDLLLEGRSGKQQALSLWIQEFIRPGRRCLLITGSESDAQALRQWLWKEAGENLTDGSLTVAGINSARDSFRNLDSAFFDRALVLTALWPRDTWALSLARQVDWLGYPLESRWQQRIAGQWSSSVQACDSLKQEWWQWEKLEAPPSRPPERTPQVSEWGQCRGEYANHNSVTVDIPDDENWIAALMAPPIEHVPTTDSPPESGEITVVTDGQLHYRYHENQKVYILSGRPGQECLEIKRANELAPGTVLVDINEEDADRDGLFELMVAETLEKSIAHRTYQSLVARWQTFIDHALYACGDIPSLHQALLRKGVDIGEPQVRNWVAHITIAPRDKQRVVSAMAQIAGLKLSEKDVASINNAQSHVFGLRSQLGRRLKQIVLASRAPNTEIQGSMSLSFDDQLIADLVRVDTIFSVHHHPVPATDSDQQTLEDLLKASVSASNGRLFATQAALRSAKESDFSEMAKAQRCFAFLSQELYAVYGPETKLLADALASVERYHIRFSGDTSEQTKGQHSSVYYRNYDNRKVDIGKHVGIGNSRDPKRCLRIHFHWDAERQQIVIHHAGKHLPTSQG